MFEKIKDRYGKGWVTLSQLARFVALGAISAAQYEQISGQAYSA